MTRGTAAVACCVVSCLILEHAHAEGANTQPSPITVSSPDGQLRLEVFLDRSGDAASVPHYRLTWKGRPVILDSPLRVDIADGFTLGDNCTIESSHTEARTATFRQHPGKRTDVIDRCNETVISLLEAGTPRRAWQVVIRAYDDGAVASISHPATGRMDFARCRG